jgi:ADP-ribose pyrophosphatase YjhB (NUDIX family)
MHHIQRKILSRLMHAPSLGYAKMRPERVESNHFAYHLDQLQREDLVIKQEHRYTLTPKGLVLADRLSHESMTVRIQPHIVTSLYITNDSGEMLLYQHLFQPYMGLYGPPQGRIHYDEYVADSATRELAEKAGLTDVPLIHRGIVYVHALQSDRTISKILAHIFTGTIHGRPELAAPTPKGVCSWNNPDDLMGAAWMAGFSEVRQLLAAPQNELFFAELETSLP